MLSSTSFAASPSNSSEIETSIPPLVVPEVVNVTLSDIDKPVAVVSAPFDIYIVAPPEMLTSTAFADIATSEPAKADKPIFFSLFIVFLCLLLLLLLIINTT